MTIADPHSNDTADACATDRSCVDSGCGCAAPAAHDDQVGPDAPSRRGLKAVLLAAACAIACLAVPLAIGGVAAAAGALAGERWLILGLAVASTIVGVTLIRRRADGKGC